MSSGRLHPSLNLSLQSLIPKTGPQNLLDNQRPISVLPAAYKIIAKTVANRAQCYLSQWIRATQTRFVKDRYILDNVFCAYEAMEWARESNQDLVILLLDFKKAYDRVN